MALPATVGFCAIKKVKVKVGFFYSATFSGNAVTSRAVQS